MKRFKEFDFYNSPNYAPTWRDPITGAWERGWPCPDCNEAHETYVAEAMICPTLGPAEALPRARGYIAGKFDYAKGQTLNEQDFIYWDLADEINKWATFYPSWGGQARREFLGHELLGHRIKELMEDEAEYELAEGGHNSALTAYEKTLIADHLPLVTSLARKRSETIANASGHVSINDDVRTHLETLGMEILEEKVRDFNPTRGVTFGAFVRKRLEGAMNNWLTRDRIDTVSSGGNFDEDLPAITKGAEGRFRLWDPLAGRDPPKPPKRSRSSTGGFKTRSYIDKEQAYTQPPSRLIAADSQSPGRAAEDWAIAQLKGRQRAVYIGLYKTNPPKTRRQLAGELGIADHTSITRIGKQARRNVRKLMDKQPIREK